jgi:alkanesulfonate monooxygenase SsuD/methylene tetrahydromethanopterin reductase-like flavin-dependent oxidoreductase (luciferase family)
MKFSVWPSPARPTDDILDLARGADKLGYYGFWFADHYMKDTGAEVIEPGDIHEVWGILPAVAAVTESIRVGSLVSPTSVHHPALLANRASTIDHVSHGRMVLGLGAGWQINEHKGYGIELAPPKQRVDRFEESIQIIRSLLDDERTTFEGEYFTINYAPADPDPVQDQLPIVVGTGGPRMCRITARHAQEWNTWGAPEMAAGAAEVFSTACEKVGVDPAAKHRSVQALLVPTTDQDRIAKALSGDMASRTIAGSNEHIVEAIGQYGELGFDEVIIPDFTLGRTAGQRLETYERIMAEIVPQCT